MKRVISSNDWEAASGELRDGYRVLTVVVGELPGFEASTVPTYLLAHEP